MRHSFENLLQEDLFLDFTNNYDPKPTNLVFFSIPQYKRLCAIFR